MILRIEYVEEGPCLSRNDRSTLWVYDIIGGRARYLTYLEEPHNAAMLRFLTLDTEITDTIIYATVG